MGEGLSLNITLAIIGFSAVVIGLSIWLERRPHEFGRMRLPTTPFLFVAVLVIIVMCAHLLTLGGAPVHHAAY